MRDVRAQDGWKLALLRGEHERHLVDLRAVAKPHRHRLRLRIGRVRRRQDHALPIRDESRASRARALAIRSPRDTRPTPRSAVGSPPPSSARSPRPPAASSARASAMVALVALAALVALVARSMFVFGGDGERVTKDRSPRGHQPCRGGERSSRAGRRSAGAGASRAARISFAVAKRSPGAFASARMIAYARASGTSGRFFRGSRSMSPLATRADEVRMAARSRARAREQAIERRADGMRSARASTSGRPRSARAPCRAVCRGWRRRSSSGRSPTSAIFAIPKSEHLHLMIVGLEEICRRLEIAVDEA